MNVSNRFSVSYNDRDFNVLVTARLIRDRNADCDADGNRGRDILYIEDECVEEIDSDDCEEFTAEEAAIISALALSEAQDYNWQNEYEDHCSDYHSNYDRTSERD